MRPLLVFALLAPTLAAQDTTIRLQVDASDAPTRLYHVHVTMPAKAGPMTLLYPEWIPGEHSPTGPITDLVGLKIQANGQPIAWTRDSVNQYAFHITVPLGAASLDVLFDFIAAPETGGFSSGASTTTELAVMNWNQLLLYPQGTPPDQLPLPSELTDSRTGGATERRCPSRASPATRSNFNPRH